MAEDDERADDSDAPTPSGASATAPRKEAEDNSVGRLLTIADGIFAIAMTLLALDLQVPETLEHRTDHDLRDYLGDHIGSYLSFVLSFYVVALLWIRHRRLMKSVVKIHGALIRDTMFLLLIVAAMPFFAGLLGRYGSIPTALALYAGANVLAILALMALARDVERLGLAGDAEPDDYAHTWRTWMSLGVFVLCIPAAYILKSHGPYFLILLALPDRITFVQRLIARARGKMES
jgi:uncharacterized membrane protein